jgi:hypothetical protein
MHQLDRRLIEDEVPRPPFKLLPVLCGQAHENKL